MDPTVGPAHGYLALYHLMRGDLDQALAFQTKAFALTPQVPNAIGAMAGLLARTGDTAGAEAIIQKLQPDAFGAPRALAIYHWILGDLNAMADWMEKAIDQHDPAIPAMLRQWYGRDLRSTPHWARLDAQVESAGGLDSACLIGRFGRRNPDLLALVDKRRHLHHQPGLQLRGLGDIRNRRALHPRLGFDHGQIHRGRQLHADRLAFVELDVHLQVRRQDNWWRRRAGPSPGASARRSRCS